MSTTPGAGPPTRDNLLNAAARLLEGDGPDAVTLRAVGHLAGVSRQAPYRHFRDKDDLLAALATRYFRDMTATLRAARPPTADARADVHAVAEAFVRHALAHPRRYALMVGGTAPPAGAKAAGGSADLLAAARDAFAVVEDAVRRCAERGLLRDRRGPVAVLLYTGLHGIVDLGISGILHDGKGLDPVRLAHDLTGNLIAGSA